MSAPMPAARGIGDGKMGDLVEDNAAFAARFAAFGGWTLFGGAAVKGAAILVFGVTPAGFLALAAAFTIEWIVGEILETQAFKLGEQLTFGGKDGIKQGSLDVFVNKQPAARGGPEGDKVDCCGPRTILGGSKWVNMNRKPAARYGDWLKQHSSKIKTGSLDTHIGGPTVEVPEKWEYQDWFKYAKILKDLGPQGIGALRTGMADGAKAGLKTLGTKEVAQESYNQALDALWGAVK